MNYFKLILILLLIFGCKPKIKKVISSRKPNNTNKISILKSNGNYNLLVNNKPFFIKGAGVEFGKIATVAENGGNSIRTWRTENGKKTGKEVLDEAYKNGLMVTMGIEVARERHGFDYNNKDAVKEQFERIKKEVIALKDHPALLIWGIGNELNLRYTNPKVWDAINDISKMIHQVDPNHLTTTMLAGISKKEIDLIKTRCNDIDLLSFQVYGKLQELPKMVREYDWNGPYIVTEWGATGHWEVPKTSWGAPIEENSSLKASNYLKRYQLGIASDNAQCLGSYVFLWGQKQERTPTWYGLFLEDGKETESVDVMRYLWTGNWPKNRTPQIKSYTLNNKTAYQNVILDVGKIYTAQVKIFDFENDKIEYRWEILPESKKIRDGGDFEERPKSIEVIIISNSNGKLKFKAPEKAGAYRLFVYADDGNLHEATANIPFLVK
jgi:hypothetical protein